MLLPWLNDPRPRRDNCSDGRGFAAFFILR
jgi:hypothetical protein